MIETENVRALAWEETVHVPSKEHEMTNAKWTENKKKQDW